MPPMKDHILNGHTHQVSGTQPCKFRHPIKRLPKRPPVFAGSSRKIGSRKPSVKCLREFGKLGAIAFGQILLCSHNLIADGDKLLPAFRNDALVGDNSSRIALHESRKPSYGDFYFSAQLTQPPKPFLAEIKKKGSASAHGTTKHRAEEREKITKLYNDGDWVGIGLHLLWKFVRAAVLSSVISASAVACCFWVAGLFLNGRR